MASMPRGEPRTVPDPAGDLYDEMVAFLRANPDRAEGPNALLRFTSGLQQPSTATSYRQASYAGSPGAGKTFVWEPRPHPSGTGAYVGGNIPIAGPIVGGVTVGPGGDDAIDIYVQGGIGAPGPYGGVTPNSGGTLEGVSGGGTLAPRGSGSRPKVGPNAVVSPDGTVGSGIGGRGGAITYGVNVDESLQELGRLRREFSKWFFGELGRLGDPKSYVRSRD